MRSGRTADQLAVRPVPRLHRTVATAVNASIELAAELLGHTDTKITVQHYIQRSEMVNPATAALLDRAFARDDE